MQLLFAGLKYGLKWWNELGDRLWNFM